MSYRLLSKHSSHFNRLIILVFCCSLFTLSQSAAARIETSKLTNLTYNDQRQKLDLYIPKHQRRKTALLFIHGGGFTTGNKKAMNGFAKLFAQGGFVSASINYRLAPKHPYPAARNDVTDALDWLKARAEMYQFNENKIVAIGYSAGGTLALNLALDGTLKLAAGVSVAGATDLAILISQTPHRRLKRDLRGYLANTNPHDASPIFQVSKHSAPIFLFHGDKDHLVPVSESVALANKLKLLEVPMLLRVFPDAGHEIMLPNKHLKQLLSELTRFLVAIDLADDKKSFPSTTRPEDL